jgi:hypothetical protein
MATRRKQNGKTRTATQARLRRIGDSTSEIVRAAAELLDEEVAAGIVTAKQMQKRFREERRLDPEDWSGALTKLRSDTHGFVNLLEGQLKEAQSKQSAALVRRLVGQSHGLLDVFFELVGTAAEVANQMVKVPPRPSSGQDAPSRRRKRATAGGS